MLLAASMPAMAQKEFAIDGRWFGSFKSQEGDRHCWLSQRKSDGTYRTDFLTEQAGTFERYTEAGRWAQSPTAWATLVESRNGAGIPARRFDYAIVQITPDKFIYRHLQSGMTFTTSRVAEDFQLPEQCGAK